MQTGKSQCLKFSASVLDVNGPNQILQTDSQHLVVRSDKGSSMRILSIEFENLKEALIK